MSYQQPHGYPVPPGPPLQQPWVQVPRPWAQTSPPTLPPAPAYPAPTYPYAAEPTMVDPLGNEPTQALPRSPWEPDHRR